MLLAELTKKIAEHNANNGGIDLIFTLFHNKTTLVAPKVMKTNNLISSYLTT
jgi:hypothetical protein